MPRYCKVRGKPGVLVANPHALDANPRRFAGQALKADQPKLAEYCDRFEPCDEVLLDDPHLREAGRRGELASYSVTVAANHEAARAAFDKAPAAPKGAVL